MIRIAPLLLVWLLAHVARGWSQTIPSLDSIHPPERFDNVHSIPVHSDSLTSSFVIFIRKEVKLHKHIYHSEQVLILDGEGQMRLGDKSFPVRKGDIILIPQNTPHALKVTGNAPMKVLSIQSPYFDGKDRVFLE
jgi:mannose-6-phosphate isomerase-like protein (cupin superfamily)